MADPVLTENEEEVAKEMFGGSIPRVDAVRGPATGLLFTVLKAGSAQDQPTFPSEEATVPAEPTTEPVVKADDPAEPLPEADELMDEARPGAAGAEVPTDAPGDPDDPASPAWEAVDAARARQAVNMVVALQRLVCAALEREAQECATGSDPEDGESAYDLSCVLDALDCILDTLAPFAVCEQAEADQRGADALSVVTKAGRVLSSANEAQIQAAVKALQNVLATLPAPIPDKEAPVADETTDTTAQPVEKAKEDGLLAVFNQAGELLGAIDPTKLTPLSTGDKDEAPEPAETPEEPAAAPDPPAEPEPAPAAPDAAVDAPAPDEAPVAKSAEAPDSPTTPDIAEVIEAAVTKALGAANEEHLTVLKSLEERIATMEAQPMPGGPLFSGATGAAPVPALRGQDGGSPGAEIEAVRKAFEAEQDPAVRADLARQVSFLTLKAAYSG